MRIRCPHCHTPIEIVSDDPLIDIECPSCHRRPFSELHWAVRLNIHANTDCKSDADEAFDQLARRMGSAVARTGWWLSGGGFAVTVFGACLISSARGIPSEFAHTLHTTGMLIMLAGFVAILVVRRMQAGMKHRIS